MFTHHISAKPQQRTKSFLPKVYLSVFMASKIQRHIIGGVVLTALLQIHWIHMFLHLLDPDPDLDPDLNPSNIKHFCGSFQFSSLWIIPVVQLPHYRVKSSD
jgi:hypothetical protein